MHPHGANRHTLDVAESGADSGIEPRRQPEIGAEAQREKEVGVAAARREQSRGLHVGHDADLRVLRIDAAAQRQPDGNEELGIAAHESAADAENKRTVEREILRMGDDALARLSADEQRCVAGPAGVENAAAKSEVELAAREPVGTLKRGTAAVRERENQPDLRPLECAIWRVETRQPGRLRRSSGA